MLKQTTTNSPKLVRDLMKIGVPTCPASTRLPDAVRRLLAEELEALVVLDECGHAVGLFGRREAVLAYGWSESFEKPLSDLTVGDAVCLDIPEVAPDIPAAAAAQIMLDDNTRELYLLHHDGGIRWPAAVLRFRDLLAYLAGIDDQS